MSSARGAGSSLADAGDCVRVRRSLLLVKCDELGLRRCPRVLNFMNVVNV